jgi:hypothetical protein
MADEEYYHPDYLDYMQKKFKKLCKSWGFK